MKLPAPLTTLLIYNFRADKRGVTAIEYGLIASMMAVVLVVAVALLTGSLSTAFTTISGDFPVK